MLDVTSEPGDPAPAGPYLTTEQAAARIGVSERTLKNWRWSGKGPEYRKHGVYAVYHVDDIEKWSRERAGRGPGRGPRRGPRRRR